MTRIYERADRYTADAVGSRIWGGIHFRRADELALETSTDIADWALDHYFQRRWPSDED
jgi:hypothetical protein